MEEYLSVSPLPISGAADDDTGKGPVCPRVTSSARRTARTGVARQSRQDCRRQVQLRCRDRSPRPCASLYDRSPASAIASSTSMTSSRPSQARARGLSPTITRRGQLVEHPVPRRRVVHQHPAGEPNPRGRRDRQHVDEAADPADGWQVGRNRGIPSGGRRCVLLDGVQCRCLCGHGVFPLVAVDSVMPEMSLEGGMQEGAKLLQRKAQDAR
jgi:hypothetical protein